jgi:protein tyrosine phosphatase (PTP) superfamily phosphohydrolase (DUF442 family)
MRDVTPLARRIISGWSIAVLMLLTGCVAHPPPVVVPKPLGVPDIRVPTAVAPQKPMPDGYVPGVENFGFISADVWRGAQPSREGFRTLGSMGVKTVIDLQEHDERTSLPMGVTYVHLPTSGWWPDRVDVDAVLAAIEKSPKPVFIHCHVGRDRTGIAVAAYRLAQGMKTSEVVRELRDFHVNSWIRRAIEQRIQVLAKQRQVLAPPAVGG